MCCVGDVWLCSGQSNMEWPVRMTLDAHSEVALSANDRIRQVTIARATSAAPRTDFDQVLEWKVAGPTTTGAFLRHLLLLRARVAEDRECSAGNHLFELGRFAHRAVDERAGAARLGGYQAPLELLGEYRSRPPLAFRHWGETWQKWWLEQRAVTQGTQPWAIERDGGCLAVRAGGARATGKPGAFPRSGVSTAWCGFART